MGCCPHIPSCWASLSGDQCQREHPWEGPKQWGCYTWGHVDGKRKILIEIELTKEDKKEK